MITKVQVNNFRNLKEFEFDLTSSKTVIAGRNAIGKSNLLNAIYVFINESIMTDNYGVGENNVDTIVPINQSKGDDHTTISLTLDDGNLYTKVYKVTYDRNTKLPNGHAWEYMINGAKYKKADFDKLFNKAMNYAGNLVGIDEKKLWTDPLYLLVKFPNEAKGMKKLRDFLELNLDCKISNEEVFAAYPEFAILKPYTAKYFNNMDTMQSDLKSQVNALNKEIQLKEMARDSIIDGVAHSLVLDELEAKKAKLVEELWNAGQPDARTQDLTSKLEKLENEKNNLIISFDAKKHVHIVELKNRIQNMIQTANLEKNKRLQELQTKKALVEANLTSINYMLTVNQKGLTSIENNVVEFENKIEALNNTRKSLLARYMEIAKRNIEDYIVCPECGCKFVDDKARESFDTQKNKDLDFINSQGKECKRSIDSTNLQLEDARAKLEELKKNILSLNADKENKEKELSNIKSLYEETMNKVIPVAGLEEAQNELKTIEATTCDTTDIDAKIEKARKNIEQASAGSANEEHINSLNDAINKLNVEIENEKALERKYQQRLEIDKAIREQQREANRIETLLIKVVEFNKAKISMLNAKVKAKTGIDFVMLESNLSNDGVKEVCYPIVNGVEFSTLNTAEKYIVGVHIIEKIKEMTGSNNKLPILMDKLEGVDEVNMERYFNEIHSQLICTKVSTNENIEIVNY